MVSPGYTGCATDVEGRAGRGGQNGFVLSCVCNWNGAEMVSPGYTGCAADVEGGAWRGGQNGIVLSCIHHLRYRNGAVPLTKGVERPNNQWQYVVTKKLAERCRRRLLGEAEAICRVFVVLGGREE